MTKEDCIYYELLTEVEYRVCGETPEGDLIPCAEEVPIGEACHKKKEYDFECKRCPYYTKGG